MSVLIWLTCLHPTKSLGLSGKDHWYHVTHVTYRNLLAYAQPFHNAIKLPFINPKRNSPPKNENCSLLLNPMRFVLAHQASTVELLFTIFDLCVFINV